MPFKILLMGSSNYRLSALLIAFILLFASCRTVRPWQRSYLNDENMLLGARPLEKFSGSVHAYREGASGGGTGKASGGCGCN